MTESEPIAEQLSSPSGIPLTDLTWADAQKSLTDSEDYLLATSSASGRVHLVPVLAVWLEGTICFSSVHQTRKTRDLTENNNCAITVPGADVDLVVEGTAHVVRDTPRLHQIADLFPTKYPWWHPLIRAQAFHDPADTTLSNPQPVYAVTPTLVFAFGKSHGFTATRWRS